MIKEQLKDLFSKSNNNLMDFCINSILKNNTEGTSDAALKAFMLDVVLYGSNRNNVKELTSTKDICVFATTYFNELREIEIKEDAYALTILAFAHRGYRETINIIVDKLQLAYVDKKKNRRR